ncbi:MAG: di-trans,poly-cis-decaprenylcistransferase [Candidatus Moranbacteria bacterium CG23_combo_of_CG06-09_8_20_14_all_35_22]|nr:MAG: di-trans,poly-cis-decaprenylcistransferase [Candidatus Moranbacteria bacterium CG23_combo_of_CG06-09_8_20_14_all_35_22]
MENNLENIPNHIAIIPDGNRRWAKNKGLKPWEGHEEGAKNLEKLIQVALKKGIKCFSMWGSSMDNLLKRPISEKKALLDIYKRYFQRLVTGKEIHENEARVNVIGRWEEQFPESLKAVIREAIEKTKHYKKRMLNFMLAYSGTDDMLQAISKINNTYQEEIKITPEILKANLMTRDLPPVDFMIRTGGEPHNSNGFLMWDSADAQLYYSTENFPDFNEEKFEEALEEYARRGRRYGE